MKLNGYERSYDLDGIMLPMSVLKLDLGLEIQDLALENFNLTENQLKVDIYESLIEELEGCQQDIAIFAGQFTEDNFDSILPLELRKEIHSKMEEVMDYIFNIKADIEKALKTLEEELEGKEV